MLGGYVFFWWFSVSSNLTFSKKLENHGYIEEPNIWF
jgi:hypothetical protein